MNEKGITYEKIFTRLSQVASWWVILSVGLRGDLLLMNPDPYPLILFTLRFLDNPLSARGSDRLKC